MSHEKIVLALGESATLSAAAAIKADDNRLSKDSKGRWGSTGSCAVIDSDDLEGESVKVVGASVGKCLIFYRQDVNLGVDESLAARVSGAGSDHMRQVEDKYAVAFEVEVVTKKEAKAPPAGPLASSSKFDGLLPMNETQEKPSEKTPYGTDQEGKPVAPYPGMVNPSDDSTVARQSEDAVATGGPAGVPAATPPSTDKAPKAAAAAAPAKPAPPKAAAKTDTKK